MVHVCNIPYSLSCSIFPVKISVFPLFIQSYWPVQTKIRQYVHWSNIVAVRLLTRATAKLNQCVVFVFRLIHVVTLYNGFTRYSIWIDNHCLAASLQPVSILPYCLKPRMKRLRLINLAAILNWQRLSTPVKIIKSFHIDWQFFATITLIMSGDFIFTMPNLWLIRDFFPIVSLYKLLHK